MQLLPGSIVLLAFIILTTDCNPLQTQLESNGGKVKILSRTKAPLRLKAGEKKHPDPGWKHCVKKVSAVERWRLITTNMVKDIPQTQFQCTWYIQAVRYDGFKIEKQLVIAIRKLALQNSGDGFCQHQFLEIIDDGKSQGRFCEKNKPGDYITIGGSVRIDIQAETNFQEIATKKQSPFQISYRTTAKTAPGFRSYTSLPARNEYDIHHIGTSNVLGKGTYSHENDATKAEEDDDNDDDDEKSEDKNVRMTVGGIAGITICCSLVMIAVLLVVFNRYCCRKEKTNSDTPSSSSTEKYLHPIPVALTSSTEKQQVTSFEIESIIASGTINDVKTGVLSSQSKIKNLSSITKNENNQKYETRYKNTIRNGRVSKKNKPNSSKSNRKSSNSRKRNNSRKKKEDRCKNETAAKNDMPDRRARKKLTLKKQKSSVNKTVNKQRRKNRSSSLTIERKKEIRKNTDKRERSKSENEKEKCKANKMNCHHKTDKSNSTTNELHNKKSNKDPYKKSKSNKNLKRIKALDKVQMQKKSRQKIETNSNEIVKDKNNKIVTRSKTSVRPLTRDKNQSRLKKKRSKSASSVKLDQKEPTNTKKKSESMKSEKGRTRTRMRYKRFSSMTIKTRKESPTKDKVNRRLSVAAPSRRYKFKPKRQKSKE